MKGITLPGLRGHTGRESSQSPSTIQKAGRTATKYVAATDTPRGRRLAQRAFQLGVIFCLVSGPVSCIARSAADSGAAPAPATASASSEPVVEMSATATAFVRAWLVATSATAPQLLDQVPDAPTNIDWPDKAPAAPTLVEAVAVDAADQAGDWTVTVHAAGGSAGVGEWYSVPLRVTDANGKPLIAILALPGRTSAPVLGAAERADSLTQVLTTNPAVTTVQGFLSAWLAGDPATSRWTVPSYEPGPVVGQKCLTVKVLSAAASPASAEALKASSIPATDPMNAAASPSPSAAVTPEGRASRATLQVTAECTTKSTTRPVQYQVTVSQNAGQWAVEAVS